MKRKVMVLVYAYWANCGDAEAILKIPFSQWKSIKNGEEYFDESYGYYEGHRFEVYWNFNEHEEHTMRITTGEGFVGAESGDMVLEKDLDEVSVAIYYLKNRQPVYIDEIEAENLSKQ